MDIEESELRAQKLIERREFHEAERLLTSLADQGSVYALMALAWLNENGRTGNKDTDAARRFYEQAISRGSTEAPLDLGLLLLKEGRQSEAQRIFEKGVEKGHIGCSVQLGWMLANGAGGDHRRAEGRGMLEKASNEGHILAQRRIISLDLSENPPFTKKISLFGRILALGWKTLFEVYGNRRSDKIW
jgi:TPR repeat protein